MELTTQTTLEKQVNDIAKRLSELAGDVKAMNVKLDLLADHEKRIRYIEMQQAKQQGIAKAIQFGIGFIGVIAGSLIKLFN